VPREQRGEPGSARRGADPGKVTQQAAAEAGWAGQVRSTIQPAARLGVLPRARKRGRGKDGRLERSSCWRWVNLMSLECTK
jgi:hypothetical protein